MSTDPQGSTQRSAQGARHDMEPDHARPRTRRRALWPARTRRRALWRARTQGGAARPPRPAGTAGPVGKVGLVTAAVAGLAVVSTGVAIGAGSARTASGSPESVVTAPPAPTQPTVASTGEPGETPVVDGPVGAPEDAPAVDLPPSMVPPVVEWDDLPEATQPPPAPEPVQTLPPLPTLPPLAPVPDVVAPGPAPSGPSAPAGPTVPTLTGPAAGTVLTTFPTVSGTADPGATVVVASTPGGPLTTAVADGTGAWSAQVCGNPATAPTACLGDSDTLTVTAHAREESGSESAASAALSWTFDRPVLTHPADGTVIEVPAQGDVPLRIDGTVGELVELSVDGTPTSGLHRVPSTEDVVWRSPSSGTHTLSLRYVTVGRGGGGPVTGFGPTRTWTVTVAEEAPVEGGPEGTPQTDAGGAPADRGGASADTGGAPADRGSAPADSLDAAPGGARAGTSATTGARPEETAESTLRTAP